MTKKWKSIDSCPPMKSCFLLNYGNVIIGTVNEYFADAWYPLDIPDPPTPEELEEILCQDSKTSQNS